LLLLLLTTGCSSNPPATPYDSEQAREVLVQALEAWKQGEAHALATRHPPIRFEDDDYRTGTQLIGFRLPHRDEPLRPFEDVEVVLTLRNRQGATVEKTVVYQVALEPALAVLRND